MNCSKHVLAELKADHVSHNALYKRDPTSICNGNVSRCDSPEWTANLIQAAAAAVVRSDSLPALMDDTGSSRGGSSLRAVNLLGEEAEASIVPRRPSAQDYIAAISEGVTDDADSVVPRQKRLNGWLLHLSTVWASTSRLAGESKESRRKRVLQQARETWDVACVGNSMLFFLR